MDLNRFQDIVTSHISRYPMAQFEDLYKLCHQAALGSEHAVKDIEAAREWLRREFSELEESSIEPLIDPISADGQIVRVHLRPYIDAGGDLESLLNAFVRTANDYKGSAELLLQYWTILVQMADCGEITYQPKNLRSLIKRMEALNFPPVHHSPEYEASYKPHYRVVAREFLRSRINIKD